MTSITTFQQCKAISSWWNEFSKKNVLAKQLHIWADFDLNNGKNKSKTDFFVN